MTRPYPKAGAEPSSSPIVRRSKVIHVKLVVVVVPYVCQNYIPNHACP